MCMDVLLMVVTHISVLLLLDMVSVLFDFCITLLICAT